MPRYEADNYDQPAEALIDNKVSAEHSVYSFLLLFADRVFNMFTKLVDYRVILIRR